MAEGWLWKHKNMKSVDECKERRFLVHFTLYSGAGGPAWVFERSWPLQCVILLS